MSTSDNGAVKVFEYASWTYENSYMVDLEYDGKIIQVTDSQKNLYDLMNQAKDSYQGSDYDLSNATITIDFTNEADPFAGGSMSITGVKPIPEPSSATLGLLGLSALLLRRKRRA